MKYEFLMTNSGHASPLRPCSQYDLATPAATFPFENCRHLKLKRCKDDNKQTKIKKLKPWHKLRLLTAHFSDSRVTETEEITNFKADCLLKYVQRNVKIYSNRDTRGVPFFSFCLRRNRGISKWIRKFMLQHETSHSYHLPPLSNTRNTAAYHATSREREREKKKIRRTRRIA